MKNLGWKHDLLAFFTELDNADNINTLTFIVFIDFLTFLENPLTITLTILVKVH